MREVAGDEVADRVTVEGRGDFAAHRHDALELARALGDLGVQRARRFLGDPLGLAAGASLTFEEQPESRHLGGQEDVSWGKSVTVSGLAAGQISTGVQRHMMGPWCRRATTPESCDRSGWS